MNAPQADPSKNMVVKAAIVDETSGKPIKFDLTFSQEGPPFIVWGTGVMGANYYYSLTRLNASGTVTIADEALRVHGLTWMDHEYGEFGSPGAPVLWFLQDMQLDNGVHLSNFTVFKKAPLLNSTTDSNVTIQFPDGTTYYEESKLTPFGRTWTSPQGKEFFLEFKIEIPTFQAAFVVTSLVDGQDFPIPLLKTDTYEGVATARGTFMGHATHGTAWNEQQPAG
jgi:predicted secreted hydrolase